MTLGKTSASVTFSVFASMLFFSVSSFAAKAASETVPNTFENYTAALQTAILEKALPAEPRYKAAIKKSRDLIVEARRKCATAGLPVANCIFDLDRGLYQLALIENSLVRKDLSFAVVVGELDSQRRVEAVHKVAANPPRPLTAREKDRYSEFSKLVENLEAMASVCEGVDSSLQAAGYLFGMMGAVLRPIAVEKTLQGIRAPERQLAQALANAADHIVVDLDKILAAPPLREITP